MGLWSISTTLSNRSMPENDWCGAGWADALLSSRALSLYRVSLMSVDFPEPETPVTHTNSPAGSSRSTPLRLLPVAPEMVSRRFRSEENTSELQSRGHLVCRLLLV